MRAFGYFTAISLCCGFLQAQSTRFDFPKHAQGGYALVDVQSGQVLTELGGGRKLIPASVIKVLTSAFVLNTWGPNKRFSTTLYYSGKIEQGILHGNLWIHGGGNPALGSTRAPDSQSIDSVFHVFSTALSKLGIREVWGKIRVDATLFPMEVPSQGALWEDVGNYYGAAPAALAFHDNTFILNLDGSPEAGHSLRMMNTIPVFSGISHFQVLAKTSSPLSGDSCHILGAFWNTPRLVIGTCPAGKIPLELKGSLPDPGWTMAREFTAYLQAHKILVRDSIESRESHPLTFNSGIPKDIVKLAEHVSPPLSELLSIVHGYSDNFYTAQLLAIPGGTQIQLKALRLWLNSLSPIIESQLRIEDGNGLSRRNSATPLAIAHLLVSFSKKSWFPVWKETLLGGKSCPVKPAAYAEGLAGKVWVKTGSMSGSAALAGYLQGRSGRLLAFAVMANHFEENATLVRNRWGCSLRTWSERN